MNNLSIFRKQVHAYLERGQIMDAQHWGQLMRHLCDLKLFNPKEVKLLNSNKQSRQYPIAIPEFEEIIMRQFMDEGAKALIKDVDRMKKQIRQAKGVLGIWKEKGLTKAQMNALEITFAKGNNRINQICAQLQKKKHALQSINEQEVQIIKSMEEWVEMQKIPKPYKNYLQFQELNEKVIEEIWNKGRVREVHFRKKAKNQSMRVVAYNSKNDEPVQVLKIPKKSLQFQTINRQLITYNALKDLSLSPYFPNFFGYNINSDQVNYLYFTQYIETKNLATLLKGQNLEEGTPIFRYWATQIYKAIYDIWMMSTYIPQTILLKHIEIAESGLRVVLKGLQFVRKRSQTESIESALLQNLGGLLLQLLNTNEVSLNDKIHNTQNKSLISALVKAPQAQIKYKQGIAPCHISLHCVQTHPLFESNQEMHGLEVMANYQQIFD